MERVLLVSIKLDSDRDGWQIEEISRELEELVGACYAQIVEHIHYLAEKPTANFFIGSGKAIEIAGLCQEKNIQTVIFGRDLSGTQQRNLEEVIGCKTIDRTQLILDIFARHAKSPEGKMQVELAQLQYILPRLIGKGLILSRTGGGIGTSGPGEQRLEVDRRRIRKKLDKLRGDLEHTKTHRQTLRKKRKDNAVPMVALVGYTNAGKSTLLNSLTSAGQVVADSLFTTLDPLAKGLSLPNSTKVVLSDTVGFLHNLPHHLIEAFKATLEEVVEADLLVHVLDVSHPQLYEHSKSVFEVLSELGAQEKPMITALNKIDLVEDKTWLAKAQQDFVNPVLICAKTKLNLDKLLLLIQKNFSADMLKVELMIPLARMDLVDLFYRQGKVEEIEYLSKGIRVKLILPKILAQKLLRDKDIEEINP